ncbi:MAG: DUF2207 domain-containing protein [Bacilli bacterium]|nr:DUF2207 domain-containing protein [Bacilli bacterium]
MDGIIKLMYITIIVIWYIVFISFLMIIYFLNMKPYKSKYMGTKIKSFPSKLKPVELSMLLYKKITSEVFTASILTLINNQNISIKKDKNDYILTLNTNNNNELDKNQKYIIDILFGTIVKSNSVKLSEIENYVNNKANATDLFTNHYIWKRMAQSETFQTYYYEPKIGYRLIIIYKYISALLVIINFVTGYHLLFAYALIILSIVLKLFFYSSYKRTKKSNDEYYKWISFKNYLLTLDNEPIELDDEQTLDYLIYSSVLGATNNLRNDIFDGMDEFTIKLNEIITKGIFTATLFAQRKIKWK